MIRRVASLLLIAAVASVAGATQNKNTEKGFNANSVYQMNGIDNINAFNGNLTLTIPIGQAYSIGGGLTYQLRLYGNGNIWEPEDRIDLNNSPLNGDCWGPGHLDRVPCVQAYPDRRANAGIGFTLSLGRLIPPDEQTNESGFWIYEAADGSEHKFEADFPGAAANTNPDISYTRDGSFLRMQVRQGNRRWVEFPNGEVHTFMPSSDGDLAPWLIERIDSQYTKENTTGALTVTYTSDSSGPEMILDDGFRQQIVHYTSKFFESGILDMSEPQDLSHRMLVSSVVLKAFGSQTATYEFHYTPESLQRPDWHTIPTWYASQSASVQLLSSLELPDGTSFSFDYLTSGVSGLAGLPEQMTLPTGGKVQWTWEFFSYPIWTGDQIAHQRPAGVRERRLYNRSSALIGTWTYSLALDGEVDGNPLAKELVVTIVDPLLNKTENYFDVSLLQTNSAGYGLPYTIKTTDNSGSRFLSQRFIPAGSSTPLRSIYARYENDGGSPLVGANPRRVSTRTVYNDDSNAYLDSNSSDYDGLGHYRTVQTSGTGVPTRTVTTGYNIGSPLLGVVVIPVATAPWLLERFSYKTVTEGGHTFKSEAHFDANGFLNRTRALKDTQLEPAQSGTDVIVQSTPDSVGNVIREEIYGGDSATVPTGDLDSLTLTSSNRVGRTDHEYSYGSLRRSRAYTAGNTPMSFYGVDNDIDANTGMPSTVRDSAGVATTFDYDTMGRLTWTKPTARAWTSYTYPNFSNTFDIVAKQFKPPVSGTTPGAQIGQSRYVVDGVGRVDREYMDMPGGVESRRELKFNALGWTLEASELGTATVLPKTVYTYDTFGRVLTTTLPDSSVMSFAYTGVRTKVRTAKISMVSPSSADTSVSTTEESDLYGRLLRVTEKSGATSAADPDGDEVVTEYGYDAADRLTHVLMNKNANPVQERFFDYDGLGRLRWESQPESGVMAYTYDARGSVLTRTVSSAASQYDLKYEYDDAGRLYQVSARNPWYGQSGQLEFRAMKTFTYGTSNSGSDLRNGKLVTAARYNYGRTLSEDDYKIEDTYLYSDAAGRRTDRVTEISLVDGEYSELLKSITMSQSYDELDLPVTVTYPMCVDCGAPPVDPSRYSLARTYDHGRLTSLGRTGQTFVSDATFWPNGMRHTLVHGNNIVDTQEVSNMARPSSLKFATYDRCVQPTITTQPANATGTPATLTVAATGTGTLAYEWYNFTSNSLESGTGASITVSPTVTSEYQVTVIGACGYVRSQFVKVSIGSCSMPTTGVITPSRQPNGSWILRPDPTTGASPTYTWRELPGNGIVGSTRELTVSALTQSKTYSLTISDSCGTSSTTNVTIAIPLAITKTGLVATRASNSSITIAWPAVSGATGYVLQRRYGPAWEQIANQTGTTYTDTGLTSSRTYAYRVMAFGSSSGENSDYSNSDVATTSIFADTVTGTTLTAAGTNEALAAVNSVRAAAGWPSLSWSNILSADRPLPSPGETVWAAHIMSCRARMNEALQALGVPVAVWTVADLRGQYASAEHVNEVKRRAQ